MTSVFWTSTSTATEASTRASSSTTRIDMKKVAPAPPWRSGISIPMIPSSKHASISSRGILASRSIFATTGRSSASANWRTWSRNICSSSERSVRGRLRALATVSMVHLVRKYCIRVGPREVPGP